MHSLKMDKTLEFSVNPRVFYGETVQRPTSSLKVAKESSSTKQPVPYKLRKLLGPSSIWKVFKKQADVLSFVNSRKCGLMSFVFQQNTGERLFLAAHPSWLWYHDSNKTVDSRSSYEIIQELTVCKLYFDIEYNKDINPFHNGVEMLEIFIKIVSFYINKHWGIKCNRKNILDMDSSTNKKFSRHLIFQLPNAVFRDNYNAGNFVKYVCKSIVTFIDSINEDESQLQACELGKFIAECNIQKHQIKNLIVTYSNGKTGIFCDQGVYTKNRHFRLFKSSKIGKQTPLVLSEQNEYKSECCEEEVFMDSLITFISNDSDRLKVLEFQSDGVEVNRVLKAENIQKHVDNVKASPFPKIDRFIESAASPGRIWRSFYFQAPNLIVYDIIGNRFCGNIGRQHKSNNIKLIVDLSNACYYQKCYDPDCAGYKSIPVPLPYEVQFHIDDDLDCDLSLLDQSECSYTGEVNDYDSLFNDHDEELSEILDTIEDIPVESFSDNF